MSADPITRVKTVEADECSCQECVDDGAVYAGGPLTVAPVHTLTEYATQSEAICECSCGWVSVHAWNTSKESAAAMRRQADEHKAGLTEICEDRAGRARALRRFKTDPAIGAFCYEHAFYTFAVDGGGARHCTHDDCGWEWKPAPPPFENRGADLPPHLWISEAGMIEWSRPVTLDWRSKHEPDCPTLIEEQHCTCGCETVALTIDKPHPPEGFKWDDRPEREAMEFLLSPSKWEGAIPAEEMAAYSRLSNARWGGKMPKLFGKKDKPDIMAATRDVARGS